MYTFEGEEMKTVLIVEDDFSAREYLKNAIPWEENGYHVIGEADNGIKALALLEQECPDIMITDIQMPRMNGVELISKMKEAGYPTKVVVLSFYDDFEYVRDAMKFGAVDYVLKHQLSEDKILKTLNEIHEDVSGNSVEEVRKENQLMKRRLQRNLNAIKRRIFQKLAVNEENAIQETGNDLEQFGISSQEITFLFGNIRLMNDRIGAFLIEEGRYDIELLEFSVSNIIEEIMQTEGHGIVCVENSLNYKVFFACDGLERELSTEKKGYNTLNKALEKLDEYLGIQAAAGMSKAQCDLKNTKKAVEQAELALENMFYKGYGNVYLCTGTVFSQDSDYIYTEASGFYEMLKHGQEISKIMERLLEHAREERLHPQLFRKVEDYILAVLLSILGRLEKNYGEKTDTGYDLHTGSATYSECREKLVNSARWIEEYLDRHQRETYEREEVNSAIRYIRQHYEGNITLEEISRHVNLSRVYFSQMFKAETGMSFTDYLIHYRIKEAQKLLRNTDLRMYEIASRVGIPDQHYFNRLFKNITGVTPAKYKEGCITRKES